MSGASVTLQPETGLYIIALAQVTDAASARDVLVGLQAAFAHWQANEPLSYYFTHRIEVGNIASDGLPVDESALHEDFREGAGCYDDGVRGLQTAWFWLHTAGLPGGDAVVRDWLAYARTAMKTAQETHKDIWEDGDAGIPLGASAVFSLAMKDAAWLPDYAAMLDLWDLGHEVHELPAINAMYAKHGWSEAMQDLVLARITADGQHQTQQVFRDLRPMLTRDLPEQQVEAFLLKALSAFRASTLSWMDWPPNKNACETFDIDVPLLALARRLLPNKVETA